MASKTRISQTLLSSWLWALKLDDGYDSFLRTLNRIEEPPNEAMLLGVEFEGLVNTLLDSKAIPSDHKWYEQAVCTADILKGAQKQVNLYREIEVGGKPFLLHGILDFLKFGTIFDTKFSKTYAVNKYLNSPQHPMYFALVPEATKFSYLICDGTYVYEESYTPEDTVPIEKTISHFMAFLDRQGLMGVYEEKWQASR